MAEFQGTLMIIGNTSFLDNVLLVRNNDPSTATSFLRNRGFIGGSVSITGTSIMIHTTPAIEVDDVQAGIGAAIVTVRRVATKRRAAKKTAKTPRGKGKRGPRK